MPYVSLYRKYRPQNFEDVVGQEHITRTLKNAIMQGHIASGYLFCGTRGTAKTTCARILAKALNCIGQDGSLVSPTPTPCGVCGPCRSIAASSFVDVVEMDAASHRGIDDMRDIVASIKFPPMEGRYKVYIIDEAHQLTNEAKDAFLKTLEEPPDRVLFILATTDQDKMPITIQSRCQVFEFKRGSVAQISGRIAEVLQTEGVKAEPGAVALLARAADGSYRDSLSLLEQVLAYKRDDITPADISMVLGTVDEEVLSQVVRTIAASDAAGAFTLAGHVLESGKDVRQFLKSLSARFRDLLFVNVGADQGNSGDAAQESALRAEAACFSPAGLLHALEVLTEAERDMRTNTQHRLLLEMALLRLMRLPAAPAVVSAPVTISTKEAAPAPPQVEQAQKLSPPPVSVAPVTPPLDSQAAEEDDQDEDGLSLLLTEELDTDLGEALELPEEEPLFADLTDPPPALTLATYSGEAAPTVAKKEQSTETDPEEVLTRLQRSWQEVINRVSSIRPAAVSLIKDARATALQGKIITLTLSNRFFVDRLSTNEAGRQMIEDQINRTLGVPEDTYRVRGLLRDEDTLPSPPKLALGVAPKAPVVTQRALEETGEQENLEHLMDEVIAVFGGRIEEDEVKG